MRFFLASPFLIAALASSILIPVVHSSRAALTATPPADRIVTNKMTTNSESTVLRELKETVQKQSKEIEALRKQVALQKTATPRGGGHGAHGGDVESVEDLEHYLKKPFYMVAFHRVGWLSLFLCSLSLTAFIMNGFEKTLHRQLELAYFVPLLAGHGGNTGGQTVGTVLSALSAGAVTLKDAPSVIAKEAMSGLLVGSLVGSLLAPVAHYIMGISSHVAVVILCTLPLVSTIASTLGSTIPFFCLAMGLDPSVIAAPAMTSFVDVSGLMSYFLIANQVFRLFGIDL